MTPDERDMDRLGAIMAVAVVVMVIAVVLLQIGISHGRNLERKSIMLQMEVVK